MAKLMKEFDAAMAEKAAVMAEAKKCQDKLDMATRLINALSANGVIFMIYYSLVRFVVTT